MRQALTTFLRNWSPWHLRKRVAKLQHDLDHLMDVRDELVSSCQQYVIKENERLTKENETLKLKLMRLMEYAKSTIVGIESNTAVLRNICDEIHHNTGDQS